jgi:argininosuccinate lyase
MAASLKGDFSTATDLADYLVRQEMPFREAHHTVGQVVKHCIEQDKGLEDLGEGDIDRFIPGAGKEALRVLSIDASVSSRVTDGGTAAESVQRQIEKARSLLAAREILTR